MDREAETGGASCCRFRIPAIPTGWLLFIDFAFTFGTTIVYFADIVTDLITLKMYWDREWLYAFGFSIGFIIGPSILLAIMECQFLIKTYGKNIKWIMVILRTILNIPFQLTVIWYHFLLSYKYMKVWLHHLREKDSKHPITEEDRKISVSNLADLDDRANTMERNAITSTEVPASREVLPAAYAGNTDHTWWKQLTREEWLSHLNKMKLTESMLESLPQLLLNVYLIVRYPDTPVIQYVSATLSYLSLCGGIVRFDKTRKDNEADRLMVDRTLLHSRAFATRLEWVQLLFLSFYKGCFLAARILVFVYFTIYFQVYVLIFVFIHWAVLLGYLVYLWYPTDIHKKTRQLVQADYKFRAYMFLSQDFISVFHNSLVGIFISVRPRNYAFLGQPYCYMFWYYFAYVIENVVLFLLPGVFFSIRDEEQMLLKYQYYIVMVFELLLNVLGAVLCTLYYFSFHKMSIYTRNAYPQFTKMQELCCCCSDLGPLVPKEWTVCKQAETSEIFYLRRDKLKEYKSGFTTVVRANRKRGRNLECFIDDRGKIFYAPRMKLFKKLPSVEEEEIVNLRKVASRQSIDDLEHDILTPQLYHRPESQSTVRNERLVGEEPSFVSNLMESKPLLSTPDRSTPPPLPTTPPQATASLRGSSKSRNSNESALKSHISRSLEDRPGTPSQSVRSGSPAHSSATSSKRSHRRDGQTSRSPASARSQGGDDIEQDKKGAQSATDVSAGAVPPAMKGSSSRSKGRRPAKTNNDGKTRHFSPENMWKSHKSKDASSSSHGTEKQSRGGNGNKSFPAHESKLLKSDEDRHRLSGHSRKHEGSKNKRHESSGSSSRDPHGISRHHDGDREKVDNSRGSDQRGDPEGQTWI